MNLTPEEIQQYSRQIILPNFDVLAQERLKNANVLIVGAGGLGCPVAQYLVAAGIGNIGIMDADIVSISNLQRQVVFTHDDIGKAKVQVINDKLSRLNPYIAIHAIPEYLNEKNAISHISKYDIVCDCTDNFTARYLVNDACVLAHKPFVSASILRYEGQLSVFNHQTKINYRDVFPEPPTEVQNCAEAGVLGVLCGIMGSMQANEVIKIATQIGESLEGKLWCFNVLNNSIQTFKIQASGITITELKSVSTEACSNTNETNIKEIDVHEFQYWKTSQVAFQLIDVREKWEYDIVNLGGELIPLSQLLENKNKIDTHKKVVVLCKSGVRSRKAVELLNLVGIHSIYSLKGGILAYINEIDNTLIRY